MLRIPNAGRQKLRTEAKAAPKIIDRDDLYSFLSECIRWGLGINRVLDDLRVPNNLRLKKWRQNMALAQIPIRIPAFPTWVEIDPANIDDDIPASWEADPVVIDPEADPPTTRPRKWSEAHLFHARTVNGQTRYFAPASDGRDYFDPDKVDAVKIAPGVTETPAESVPNADEL